MPRHVRFREYSLFAARWLLLAGLLVAGPMVLVPTTAAAQGCQQVGCDEVPPVVTPTFSPAVLPDVAMQITWCDNEWLMPATRTITLNGQNVVGSFSYTATSGACASQALSLDTMTLNAGTTYTLFATIEDEHGNIGTGSVEYTTPNGWVAVNPKGLSVSRPQQSTNLTQDFVVRNLTASARDFRLVRTCLGNLSSCSAVPDTIHVNGGDSSTVSVTYNTGLITSGSTGTIRLRARMTTDTTVADSTDVGITLISSLIVDDSPSNHDAQNMNLCAYACFANIYSQSTVPYFSLDQPRGVTLVYNHLRMWERPYLLFNVSNVAGAPAINKLKLAVRDSVTGGSIRVQGDNNNEPGIVYFRRDTGTVRLATFIRDDSWLPTHGTGIHPVQVTVTAIRTGLADEVDTLFVPVLVVREPAGAVARGWYIAGMQRLIPQSGGRVIVVEADGSAFVFTATDTLGSYQAPAGEFSRLSRSGSGTSTIYTRAYPDSAKVRFDYQGQMLEASDSWGKKIRYSHDGSGRPTRIYDPFRTRPDSTVAPSAYIALVYFTDSVQIRPPQADGSQYDATRVTTLRLASDSTLRAIVDPDRDSTRFKYKSGILPFPQGNRLTYMDSVFDRSGALRASFAYDQSGFQYIGSMTLWMTKAATIPTHLSNGNTTNTDPTVTLFDWRGRGIPGFPTTSTSLGSPAGLDTLYSDVRDAGSHISFARHDRWGQLLSLITHNKKDTTTYFRTGLFADSVRHPVGTMDRFSYSLVAGGRPALSASTPAGQSTTFFTYDSLGHVSLIAGATTPQTRIRRLTLNPVKVDTVSVAGFPTGLEYDAWGRLTKSKDAGGHIVEYSYDSAFGNTRKILYEGTRFDAVGFDAYGRDSILTSTTAATRFVRYDSLNRVTRDSVAGASGATVYGYNKEFLVRVVDPKGQVFKREVNALGWTRKVYDAADTTKYVRHEYTSEGLPAFFVNRRGHAKEMTYFNNDNRHLVTEVKSDAAPNFNAATYAYGYRLSGNVRIGTFVVGSNRFATDTVLSDVHGRPQTVITNIRANRAFSWGDSVIHRRYVRSYTWTSDGLLQSLVLKTHHGNDTTPVRAFTPRNYWWNASTRALDSITLTGTFFGSIAKVTRDVEGKDSTWTLPGGITASVYATKRHEPWAQSYTPASIDSVLRRGYAYADTIIGRIKEMNWQAGGDMHLRPFRYSPQGDLTWLRDLVAESGCESFPAPGVRDVDGYICTPGDPTIERTLGLEYDAARNLRKQVDSVSSAVDTAVVALGNRLTSWGGTSYTYDADGNMISRTTGGVTTSFTYDGEGLLRRAIVGADTTCYEYNAFDQLILQGTGCAAITGFGTTGRKVHRIYLWDRDHIMAELDSLGTTRLAEYVYRPGVDRPHALLTDSAGTTIVRFYHQDMLGNVIGLTRGSSVSQTLAYEPWGELTGSTGTLADTSRLRWKGLYWEGGNTNLYYVRNRWYDPEARRFTTEDPIGIDGGMNLYTFAGNDWVNRVDPSGLAATTCPYFSMSSSEGMHALPLMTICARPGGGALRPRAPSIPDTPPADPDDVTVGQGGGPRRQPGPRSTIRISSACVSLSVAALSSGAIDWVGWRPALAATRLAGRGLRMYTRSWNPSIVRVHGHIWGRVEQAKLERAGSLALMSAGPDFAAQAAGVTPYGDFSVLDFLPWVGTGKLAIQAFRECTG